jgi:hypothetical protein
MRFPAVLFLALLLPGLRDDGKALRWYQKAAEPGNTEPKSRPLSRPIVYGLVVDNTDFGSLNDEITMGTLLVSGNAPADKTFIVRFTNSDNITVLQDFTGEKAALADAMDNTFAESGPPAVLDAVHLAAEHLADRKKASPQEGRALILIVHGADVGSYHKIDGVLSLLREKGIELYVIGLKPDEAARTFLVSLAKRSGGKAFFPASGEDAEMAAREILSAIRKKH